MEKSYPTRGRVNFQVATVLHDLHQLSFSGLHGPAINPMVTIKVFIMSLADFVLSQLPILSVALSVAHSQVRLFRGDGSRACNAAYSGCSGNRVFQFSSLPGLC